MLDDFQLPGNIKSIIALLLLTLFLKFVFSPLINFILYVRIQIVLLFQSIQDNRVNKDSRAPVIYLRNFTIDGNYDDERSINISSINKFQIGSNYIKSNVIEFNEERRFAREFRGIGPFIAFNNEKKTTLDQIGATRKYVSNSIWQTSIKQSFKVCAIIFIRLNREVGQSTKWELEYILSNDEYLKKTIFFFEIDFYIHSVFFENISYENLYLEFQKHQLILPSREVLNSNRYLYFNKEKMPIPSQSINDTYLKMKDLKEDVRLYYYIIIGIFISFLAIIFYLKFHNAP